MRQINCCKVRKNELIHRMLRVLIRNISNQHMGQYFIQEISLPDILAKATYTYSLPINFREVQSWWEGQPMKLAPLITLVESFCNVLL